jgi:hypothetical protein
MNRKVIAVIAVILVVGLVTLAVLYAPSMLEAILRMHRIPQH